MLAEAGHAALSAFTVATAQDGEAPPLLLDVLDLVGIFVFAVSGGLLAVRKQLDIVGVLVLAIVTGLGGGFLRDVLIGDVPPAALTDWRYLTVPLAGGLVTFFLHPGLARIEWGLNAFDAAGLGLFSVTGALKALEAGLGPAPAVLLGVLTGVGGGVLRDVLTARVPAILRRNELYAIPAAAGAALAVLASAAALPPASAVVAAFICTGWRLLAMRRGWSAPTPLSRE
jgi:uncharacterized membrane protein YeiH